ncbi:MAG: hypothetical protein VYC69_03565 [Chloroflexota bacterium]|nr:hypothetical protein [Chloroflexota bacterium]
MFGRLGVVARTVSVWKGANWTIAPRAFCRRPSNGLTSPPGLFRLLKVPRTIAELEGAEGINIAQLAEALQYRPSTAGIWIRNPANFLPGISPELSPSQLPFSPAKQNAPARLPGRLHFSTGCR